MLMTSLPAVSSSGHDVRDGSAAGAVIFWRQLLDEMGSGESTHLLDGYAGVRLSVATLRYRAHLASEQHTMLRHRQIVLVVLQLEGQSSIEQFGHCRQALPGHFYVVDLSRPFRLETGDSLVQAICLPRLSLHDTMAGVEKINARSLHGNQPGAAYLRAVFLEMQRSMGELGETSADRLAEAIPHLLAMAVDSIRQGMALSSGLRQHHKRQVHYFVREHLRDPDLSVDSIGKGVGLSPSYLFELFEEERMTLMRWVRHERLEGCRRDLSDPLLRHRSVAQVAHAWGFGDLANFSRMFRKAYGLPPSAWRKQTALASIRNGRPSE